MNQVPENLPEWLSYLEQLHPKNIALGLERVALVKRALGLSFSIPVITVAGTNGKGSTCAMLEAILNDAGYRVGCYTSPHLLRYNERVRVSRIEITDANLCAVFAAVEQGRNNVALTYFEFGTLAAVLHFVQSRVDAMILEVGLGGRLDAVNVFDADCAIVTSVDIDHIDYLGDTREAIGFEKIGIARQNKPVICGEPDIPVSILNFAEKSGTLLYRVGHEFSYEQTGVQWQFHGPRSDRHALPFPALRGTFQLNNAAVCIAALDELKEVLPISVNNIRNGLLDTQLTGRFQVLPGRPAVILDVAHNPHAALALAENLKRMPCSGKTIAVFAMLADKDIAGVVGAIKHQINHWVLADIKEYRGAAARELSQILEAEGIAPHAELFENVALAYQRACIMASENDRIVVFGSFYTVAAILGNDISPYSE